MTIRKILSSAVVVTGIMLTGPAQAEWSDWQTVGWVGQVEFKVSYQHKKDASDAKYRCYNNTTNTIRCFIKHKNYRCMSMGYDSGPDEQFGGWVAPGNYGRTFPDPNRCQGQGGITEVYATYEVEVQQ